MKMQIWKFPLSNKEELIEMPKGAKILCVQTQIDEPQIWALVNPLAEKEQRQFSAIPTGKDFMMNGGYKHIYIGTFQMEGGKLIYHLFELKHIKLTH